MRLPQLQRLLRQWKQCTIKDAGAGIQLLCMVTDVADYRAERIFSPARLIGYVGAGRHASKMHCDFIEYLVCKVRCAEDEYASHQKIQEDFFRSSH